MADGKSLKEQNAVLIRAAMIGHIVAFAWIAAEPLHLLSMNGPALVARLEAAAVPGTAAFGLIVVASLLLLGLINPNWRDRIMHWRWHDPLPGCRAFTSVGPHSSHVDMELLEAQYGPLPLAGKEQNKLFYRIYREFRDDVGVLDAHGRYLAARDIGLITALVVVPLPVLAWWASGNGKHALVYGVVLFLLYMLCAVAAKNYSWRMVQHVLALASSKA
ncbi:hypothetical protein FHS78_003688 [Parvibaculum indicum]|uniref:hypothetical protein n=1 Tax=Parvibaculum indicum TaxID=562969 RepID=UPI00141F3263|nr:hypothetical protein [Parvibaculum indicum]NIJ43373.1 hypothetical protein [Parvibaculum indicum]